MAASSAMVASSSAMAATSSLQALCKQEEDMELLEGCPMSSSEDEGDNDGGKKHQKLLEAISSLDGKTSFRRKPTERSEAGLEVSEFGVSCKGTREKLALSDLLKSIKSSSSLAPVRNQLNRIKSKKTVDVPLSKGQTEQIRREVAYNKTSKEVTKWDPIVLKNRTAEQLIFPLNQEHVIIAPIEEAMDSWKARTPLEQEIFSILNQHKQPKTDPLLTPMEKASFKAMSLEEAMLRRAEMQKARVLQSYYEARASREKKIKSKSYHKMLRKGKAKEALKKFEALRKSNPAAALEELEKIEKARMQERMSLKHQNSGKWARSKAIMAKYDLEARKAMQEQLAKNKELTVKVQKASDSEEEKEPEEDSSLIPEAVNEVQMSTDGPNPWMQRTLGKDTKDAAVPEEPKPPAQAPALEESESEEEEPGAEVESLLREFQERRSRRQSVASKKAREKGVKDPFRGEEKEVLAHLKVFSQKIDSQQAKVAKKPEAPAPQAVAAPQETVQVEEGPLLDERLERVRTLEDIDRLGSEERVEEEPLLRPPPEGGRQGPRPPVADRPPEKKQKIISLKAILEVNSQPVESSAAPIMVQEEEEEEQEMGEEETQKQMIQEAFAGDDVVADFLKEKHQAEEASKPQTVDLTLPGWGEWGGVGLKPSRKKQQRFLIKPPEGSPRKDRHLPNVIINEKRNVQAAAHQVNQLPFPFIHHQHFEKTIQTPVGTTWNTQRAFQKLTIPRVVTKPGHIIEPISAEEAGTTTSSQKARSVRKPRQRDQQKRRKRLNKK
ncbi:U3 small nucleolar RNA-associated protein 14 homolog A isoform X3 [Tachyglossus aculeatus]|uniref:U3 small nucleolar RNA-associated protein 14 homolog A isoform X3 n=1 Tax=Tachyglossus aculeatus TaxID=9261 RepID=UPI0018F52499|nr:U3 small nucleolar RNA-associated protein 14 homolog A isoform X3 [Tachyglossus aculeatus]